jgi:hypothetical protein
MHCAGRLTSILSLSVIAFATVTPSFVILGAVQVRQSGTPVECEKMQIFPIRTSIRLFDDNGPASRTERDRDCLCKDVHACEHCRTSIVGELESDRSAPAEHGPRVHCRGYLYVLVREADVLQAALGKRRGTHGT